MPFALYENKSISEKYYHLLHKSGLNVFLFPKKHATAYATFATKFGSADNTFLTSDGKTTVLPDGVAHFLEHKMFESEKGGDAFEEYAKFGGNSNAYTSEDKTVYLFSSTDCFYDNLKVLLNHVTHPYFTDENVSKEQGIICQEISMYDDNPNWRVFFNMLDCLYVNHPVKHDIAGTAESIAKITPDLLYLCHSLFYNLNNMVLCIAGDVDKQTVESILDTSLTKAKPFDVKLLACNEPEEINKPRIIQTLEVAMPMFCIGYKSLPLKKGTSKEYAAMEIITGIIFGKSSEFYNKCYENGLFNRFSASFQTIREDVAFLEIAGAANDPDAVYKAVKDEIDRRYTVGFLDDEFTRAKKVLYADIVCAYDSTDDIANSCVTFFFEGDNMLDYPNMVASVDKDYAFDCFKKYLSNEKSCISIISPKNKEE